MIGLMVVLLMSFSRMVSMVLFLRGVGSILGNEFGIEGQNYVVLLQGSEMSTGIHSRNLILIYNILGPAKIASFVFLALFEDGERRVSPRFHLFVFDVNQGNEEVASV